MDLFACLHHHRKESTILKFKTARGDCNTTTPKRVTEPALAVSQNIVILILVVLRSGCVDCCFMLLLSVTEKVHYAPASSGSTNKTYFFFKKKKKLEGPTQTMNKGMLTK
jgi:hypothetical protein